MKRLALVFLAIALAGCASGGSDDKPKGPEPQFDMYQVGDHSFSLRYSGVQAVGFELTVSNPTTETLTLRHIKFSTIGTGAYYVDQTPQFFNLDVPPRQTAVKAFSLRVYAQGGDVGSREPVTLRAIVQYEGPEGKFQKIYFPRLNPTDG
ncbi:MAG TPA: hypothetical protein VFV54_09475 [Thermoanaerobaculia bacterium]|nr:hypothetical protein [Thermoanaerobaculia bacterium]